MPRFNVVIDRVWIERNALEVEAANADAAAAEALRQEAAVPTDGRRLKSGPVAVRMVKKSKAAPATAAATDGEG